jgi:hypothetical protein
MVRTLLAALLLAAALPAQAQLSPKVPWMGVRLGGLYAVSSAGGGTPCAGGAGAYALFDGRDFLADVGADAYFGDGARFLALGLGAYLPFSAGRISPYLGGGLKVGYTSFGGDGAFGMIPFAAVGVVVGREGYVQLRAELAWFLAAAREDRTGRPGAQGVRAHGPLATLGVAF